MKSSFSSAESYRKKLKKTFSDVSDSAAKELKSLASAGVREMNTRNSQLSDAMPSTESLIPELSVATIQKIQKASQPKTVTSSAKSVSSESSQKENKVEELKSPLANFGESTRIRSETPPDNKKENKSEYGGNAIKEGAKESADFPDNASNRFQDTRSRAERFTDYFGGKAEDAVRWVTKAFRQAGTSDEDYQKAQSESTQELLDRVKEAQSDNTGVLDNLSDWWDYYGLTQAEVNKLRDDFNSYLDENEKARRLWSFDKYIVNGQLDQAAAETLPVETFEDAQNALAEMSEDELDEYQQMAELGRYVDNAGNAVHRAYNELTGMVLSAASGAGLMANSVGQSISDLFQSHKNTVENQEEIDAATKAMTDAIAAQQAAKTEEEKAAADAAYEKASQEYFSLVQNLSVDTQIPEDNVWYEANRAANEQYQKARAGESAEQELLQGAASSAMENIALGQINPSLILPVLSAQGAGDSIAQGISEGKDNSQVATEAILKFLAGYAINSVGTEQLVQTMGYAGARNSLANSIVEGMKKIPGFSTLYQNSPLGYGIVTGGVDNAFQGAAETFADKLIENTVDGKNLTDGIDGNFVQQALQSAASGGLSGAIGGAAGGLLGGQPLYQDRLEVLANAAPVETAQNNAQIPAADASIEQLQNAPNSTDANDFDAVSYWMDDSGDMALQQTQNAVQQAAAVAAENTAAQPQADFSMNIPSAMGSAGVTYTSGNAPVNFRYAVVDANQLVASNDANGNANPLYPAELQPRDRSRAASQTQMQQMAKNLNPALLADSPTAQNGSPIVTGDGVVVSGNARTAAIQQAYQSGNAEGYRQYILQNAQRFGIDPSSLPENPVLVRVADPGTDARALSQSANESTTSAYSASENAVNYGEQILESNAVSLMAPNDTSDVTTANNRDFVRSILQQIVPESQMASMVQADGSLSKTGKHTVEQAIFGAVYGDSARLSALTESVDETSRNITTAMRESSMQALAVKQAIKDGYLFPEADISAFVSDAADLIQGIKEGAYGDVKSVMEYVENMPMDNSYSPESLYIAAIMDNNKRSGKKIAAFLNGAYRAALNTADPNQISFGGVDNGPDAGQIARTADQQARKNVEGFAGADFDAIQREFASQQNVAGNLPAEQQVTQPDNLFLDNLQEQAENEADRLLAYFAQRQANNSVLQNTNVPESIGAMKSRVRDVSGVTQEYQQRPSQTNSLAATAEKYGLNAEDTKSVTEKMGYTVTREQQIARGNTLIDQTGVDAFADQVTKDIQSGKNLTDEDVNGVQALLERAAEKYNTAKNQSDKTYWRNMMVRMSDVAAAAKSTAGRILGSGNRHDAQTVLIKAQQVLHKAGEDFSSRNPRQQKPVKDLSDTIEDIVNKEKSESTDTQTGESLPHESNSESSVPGDATVENTKQKNKEKNEKADSIGEKWEKIVEEGDEALSPRDRLAEKLLDAINKSNLSGSNKKSLRIGIDKIADTLMSSKNKMSAAQIQQYLQEYFNTGIFGGYSQETVDYILETCKKLETMNPESREYVKLEQSMFQHIAANMDTLSWADKIRAYRYFSMLFGPRTWEKNQGGNVSMGAAVAAKDKIKVLVESAANATVLRNNQERTAALSVPAADYGAAYNDASEGVYRTLNRTGRYENVGGLVKDIQQARHVFGGTKAGDTFEVLRNSLSSMLDNSDRYGLFGMAMWGDNAVSRQAQQLAEKIGNSGVIGFAGLNNNFARAAAQYAQANGYSYADLIQTESKIRESVSPGATAEELAKAAKSKTDSQKLEILAKAREYGIRQALDATFHSENEISEGIAKLERYWLNSKHESVRLLGHIVEGLIPFVKTPTNVTAQAIRYSPAELALSAYDVVQAARGKSTKSNAEIIDNISAGLTGSAVTLLGWALGKAGILYLTGDDEDEYYQSNTRGKQNYSVVLPDGSSYTIDWITPEMIPLFAGVQIAQDGISIGVLWDSMISMGNAILDTSMLSSLSESMSQYEDNGLVGVLSNAATSYAGQFIPTGLKQIGRAFEPYVSSNYSGEENDMLRVFDTALNRNTNWIPFLQNEISYDQWGRPMENVGGNFAGRLAYNMLSPGYYSQNNTTLVDQELDRLVEELGTTSLYPSSGVLDANISASQMENGEKHRMTEQEMQVYSQVKGQTSYSMIEELISTDAYAALDEEEKADAIQDIYSLAKKVGMEQAVDGYENQNPGKLYEVYTEEGEQAAIEYLLSSSVMSAGDNAQERASAILDAYSTPQEIGRAYAAGSSDTSVAAKAYDKYGEMVTYYVCRMYAAGLSSGDSKDKLITWINANISDTATRRKVFDIMSTAKNPY